MSKAIINIQGTVGSDTTLLGVIRQFKGFDSPSEVEVIIDSNGGSVDEGMSIYNYLRKLGLPITTKASRAYSIAASIFMAGDIRLLEEGANRFMIHMPLVEMRGGSKMIEQVQPMLKEIEDHFTEFYSNFIDVDQDSVRRLLENETFLSAQEAVDMGIATGTYSTLKAVAFYNEEIKPKKENSIMTKAEKFIKAMSQFLNGDEKTPEAVALVLQDANGDEVNFPDLDENESPEQGSKVDGREDGEILMPDGSKIIVENGAVKEIIPAPEEEQEEQETPEEEATAEDNTEHSIEPSAENQEETEEEVDYTALFEQFEAKILTRVEAQYKEREDALKAELTALRKEVGSEIDNEPTPNTIKTNSQSGNYLTNALRKRQGK